MMSNEYKDWERERNKELCDRYPFLIPRNRQTGRIVDPWNYSHTELDLIPTGWAVAFGEIACEEIREQLIKEGNLDNYRIAQLKEKYGTLRWYSWDASDEVQKIEKKWEYLSQFVCQKCGEIHNLVLIPNYDIRLCEKCAERFERLEKYFMPIRVQKIIIEHPEYLESWNKVVRRIENG